MTATKAWDKWFLEKILEPEKPELQCLDDHVTLFNKIIPCNPVPQFVIDHNHRVISWNTALEIITGIRAEDVIGTTHQWKAFYPENRPCIADLLVEDAPEKLRYGYQKKTGTSGLAEDACTTTEFFPKIGKSGSWLHCTAAAIRDEKGTIIGAVETIEDITDQKAVEDALRKSEALFRSIIQNSPDVFFFLDDRGVITFESRATERVLGYRAGEREGSPVFNYVHPEDILPLQETFACVIRQPEETVIPQFRVRHADGTWIWFEAAGSNCPEDPGIRSIVVSSRDITPRKQVEQELQQATRKMNLMSQIMFNDLWSTLLGLSALIELEKEVTKNEKLKAYMEKQLSIVIQIEKWITNAKNYNDLGLKPPLWQNVHQSFLYAVSHLNFLSIEKHVMVKNLEILAEPLLENVFYMLSENVIRHGKTVTEVSIRYHVTKNGIIIVFQDNGVGIPESMKEAIFERTHEHKKGLGLYFAREILSITGISIRETGSWGSGARLEIEVPAGAYRFEKP